MMKIYGIKDAAPERVIQIAGAFDYLYPNEFHRHRF
jgi:hypothetical protein